MMLIRARAPLRLGLAGGGTDVSPYCDLFGGNVLNATINRYAYAVIRPLETPLIRFTSIDQNCSCECQISDSITLDGKLDLLKAVYNEIIATYNKGQPLPIELSTFCDAPAGSGLGSSSTIVVAMVKAFVELLNLPLDDYQIAQTAFKIERHDCDLKGGRQDQYSATFGGFNFMEFYEDRAIINPLRVKNWIICELESLLLLYYTGVSRQSANIIAVQTENMQKHSHDSMEPFHGIKKEAVQMKECLLKGDFDGIAESMRQGWENKKKSASTVSNYRINEIYNAAIESGASVGKVSGAGGGGFMMFLVPPEYRMDVINTLNKYSGYTSNVHFTKNGAEAWRII